MFLSPIFAISLATVRIAQIPDLPVIEVSGENNYIESKTIIQLIRDAHPNKVEPVQLSNDGVVFFDMPDRYIYFDPAFRPLRVLLAKKFIIDRMIRGGFHPVISYGEMSPYLAKEFYIRVQRMLPESTIFSSSATAVETHMASSIKLGPNTLNFQQTAESTPTPQELTAMDTLSKNYIVNPKTTLRQPPPDLRYAEIFAGSVTTSSFDLQRDRKILQLFAAWAKKENDDMDRKLFLAGEEKQAWSGLTEFLRSKTLSEVAHTSPRAYAKITSTLLDNYQSYGYNDSDAMRNALNSAPMATTSGFQFKFFDNHGSVFTFQFP